MLALLAVLLTASPHKLASVDRSSGCMGGDCPSYALTVFDDGSVEFEPHRASPQKLTKKITSTQVEQIKKVFADAQFLTKKLQGCGARDASVTTLFFSDGKKEKTVTFVGPNKMCPDSEVLAPIADKVVTLTGVEDWIAPLRAR